MGWIWDAWRSNQGAVGYLEDPVAMTAKQNNSAPLSAFMRFLSGGVSRRLS